MKKARNIHNLDTLEREIYRLRLEAKKIEGQLDSNFDYLQENFSSLFMNSFFHKKKHHEEEKSSFFDSIFKNERFNAAISRLTGHIADRASDGIESLLDKLFNKKK